MPLKLDVAENPLRFPPIDVVRRGRQAILDFLQQELTEPGKCIAEGPGIQAGLVGLPASFTIIAHTAAGIKRAAGGDNFIVRLVPISVIDGSTDAEGTTPAANGDSIHANGTSTTPASANGSSAPNIEKIPVAGISSQEARREAPTTSESKKKRRHRRDSDDSASFTDESEDRTEDSDVSDESTTESSEDAPQVPIEVSPPEPVDTALYGIVVDNYDGTYSVQYTLESAAEYHIEVTLYGDHIENSPFYLKVEPDLRHEYRQMEKRLEEERSRREAAEAQVATLQREKADMEAQIRSLQSEVNAFTSERSQFAETIHHLKLQSDGSGLALNSPNRASSKDLRVPLDLKSTTADDSTTTPRTEESPRSGGSKSERRKSGRSKHRNDSSIPRNTSMSSAAENRENGADDAAANADPELAIADSKELKRERRKSKAAAEMTPVDSTNGASSGNVTRESSLKDSSKGEPKTPSKSNKNNNASGNVDATAVQSPGGPNYKRTNSTPNNAGRNVRSSIPPADLSRSNSDYPLEPTTPTSAPDSEAIETKVPSFKDRFMFWLTRSKSSSSSDTSVKKTKKDDKKEKEKEKEKDKEKEKEKDRKDEDKKEKEDKKESKKARRTSVNLSPSSPNAALTSSSNNAANASAAPSDSTPEPKDKKKKKSKDKEGSPTPDTPLSTSNSTTNQYESAQGDETTADLPSIATTVIPEEDEKSSPAEEEHTSKRKKTKKPHLAISGVANSTDESGATPRGQTPRNGNDDEEPDSARKRKTKKKSKKPKKEEDDDDVEDEGNVAPKVVRNSEYPSSSEE